MVARGGRAGRSGGVVSRQDKGAAGAAFGLLARVTVC